MRNLSEKPIGHSMKLENIFELIVTNYYYGSVENYEIRNDELYSIKLDKILGKFVNKKNRYYYYYYNN